MGHEPNPDSQIVMKWYHTGSVRTFWASFTELHFFDGIKFEGEKKKKEKTSLLHLKLLCNKLRMHLWHL